jgi:hypothetical protein
VTQIGNTCNDSGDDGNDDDKYDSHKEDNDVVFSHKEDDDVVLTLRDERFNEVIMEYIQRQISRTGRGSLSYQKKACRRSCHIIAKQVMGELKKGGGTLLLQVGGGRRGSFRGYRASNDADAIKREFGSSASRCFFMEIFVVLYAPSDFLFAVTLCF